MTILPDFTEDGLLPPGDYVLTIEELKQSMLVQGPKGKRRPRGWNVGWRMQLVENLGILVRQLRAVGITEIFADGSFAENKAIPNDLDGYFVCDERRYLSGALQRDLNLIDPHGIWTWDWESRRPFRRYHKAQLPMWHRYRVELYPHYGQSSGIRDEFGYPLEFPSAFRKSRLLGKPRGIIKIGNDHDSN